MLPANSLHRGTGVCYRTGDRAQVEPIASIEWGSGMETLAWVFGVGLLATLTKSLTGFGAGLVLAGLSIVLSDRPEQVVYMAALLEAAVGVVLLYQQRAHVRFLRIVPLTLASVIGIPIGLGLLSVLQLTVLRLAIGLAMFLTAFVMLFEYRQSAKRRLLKSLGIGLGCGAVSAATGVSGAPMVLFKSSEDVSEQEFRATMVAYFFVFYLLMLVGIYVMGDLGWPLLGNAWPLAPALVVGLVLGRLLEKRIRLNLFRRIMLLLISAAGLYAVGAAATR